MSLSIVRSRKAPDTLDVRDDKWEELFEDEDSFIVIKSMVTSGDQELITKATYETYLKSSDERPGVQESETKYNAHLAVLATGAVMIVGFKGPLFEDPDTGRPLAVAGSLEERMEALRQIPQMFLQFVDSKVYELSRNPFQHLKLVKASKGATGRVSTKG